MKIRSVGNVKQKSVRVCKLPNSMVLERQSDGSLITGFKKSGKWQVRHPELWDKDIKMAEENIAVLNSEMSGGYYGSPESPEYKHAFEKLNRLKNFVERKKADRKFFVEDKRTDVEVIK
jgi:hypothetical protein